MLGLLEAPAPLKAEWVALNMNSGLTYEDELV